eukprot:TRINITY_DN7696_c0_g1_i1.p1 TRINITY_DN7696_c0_g1~~TRINITY_DN7696_c0_g1_i1.p1  ORF type:complete len:417 (-),score=58.52 TRINITY_DN7696_c0_g1_i1:20-1141(-)
MTSALKLVSMARRLEEEEERRASGVTPTVPTFSTTPSNRISGTLPTKTDTAQQSKMEVEEDYESEDGFTNPKHEWFRDGRIAPLRVLCIRLVEASVTESNVLELLQAMHRHSHELKEFCFKFVLRNYDRVSRRKAFKNLDPEVDELFNDFKSKRPRVIFTGTAVGPKSSSPSLYYNSNRNNPSTSLRGFEDCVVLLPLDVPTDDNDDDDEEEESKVVARVTAQVMKFVDFLGLNGFNPCHASNGFPGPYMSSNAAIYYMLDDTEELRRDRILTAAVKAKLQQKFWTKIRKIAADHQLKIGKVKMVTFSIHTPHSSPVGPRNYLPMRHGITRCKKTCLERASCWRNHCRIKRHRFLYRARVRLMYKQTISAIKK